MSDSEFENAKKDLDCLDSDSAGEGETQKINSQLCVDDFVVSEDESDDRVRIRVMNKMAEHRHKWSPNWVKFRGGKVLKGKKVQIEEGEKDPKKLSLSQRMIRANYRLSEASLRIDASLKKYNFDDPSNVTKPIFAALKSEVHNRFINFQRRLNKERDALLAQLSVLEKQANEELPKFVDEAVKYRTSLESSKKLVGNVGERPLGEGTVAHIEHMAEDISSLAHNYTKFPKLDVKIDRRTVTATDSIGFPSLYFE